MAANNIVLGIDFGATKVTVFAFTQNKVEIVLNDGGDRSTPACTAFTEKGRLFSHAAKFQESDNPENTLFGRGDQIFIFHFRFNYR